MAPEGDGWITCPELIALLIAGRGMQVGDEIYEQRKDDGGDTFGPYTLQAFDMVPHDDGLYTRYGPHGKYWKIVAWRRPLEKAKKK